MKTLLLIPNERQADPAPPGPRREDEALTAALNAEADGSVTRLDFADAARNRSPAVRLARAWGGPEAALAMLGFQRRRRYDVVCSLSEGVGVPLALLLNTVRTRPGHVCCARSLTSSTPRSFWTFLQAHRGLDTVFVPAQSQQDFAEDQLGLPTEKLSLISPALDEHFFRPAVGQAAPEDLLGVVGGGGRDYATLARALKAVPDLAVGLAASPPLPQALNALSGRVTVRPNTPAERRALYARALFVAVPLRDRDAPLDDGVLLEAMAMGKAVIATRTPGQAEVITEGMTGLTVAPGDGEGWRQAITRLRGDPALRERLGRSARRWVEEHATLERWAERVRHALREAALSESGARFGAACVSSAPIFW